MVLPVCHGASDHTNGQPRLSNISSRGLKLDQTSNASRLQLNSDGPTSHQLTQQTSADTSWQTLTLRQLWASLCKRWMHLCGSVYMPVCGEVSVDRLVVR